MFLEGGLYRKKIAIKIIIEMESSSSSSSSYFFFFFSFFGWSNLESDWLKPLQEKKKRERTNEWFIELGNNARFRIGGGE